MNSNHPMATPPPSHAACDGALGGATETRVCNSLNRDATAHHCVLIFLVAALKGPCTSCSVKPAQSRLNTRAPRPRAPGSRAARVAFLGPVIYAALLSHDHEERSHTPLWSFLVRGLVREKCLTSGAGPMRCRRHAPLDARRVLAMRCASLSCTCGGRSSRCLCLFS